LLNATGGVCFPVAVNALRTKSSLRAGLFIAVLLSWFAFSNRCALGLLLSSTEAAAVQHQCCDKKDAPPESPASKGMPECCKAFHAVAQGGVKAPLDPFVFALTIVFRSDLLPGTQGEVVQPGAGLPPADSFTELVLHRSLRSHAPPRLA